MCSLSLNAQKTITHDKVHKEILNSYESVLISFYSNQLEQQEKLYFIELDDGTSLTEPPLFNRKTKEQLTAGIVTTRFERKVIIDYLNKKGYLERLYVRVDNNYANIKNPIDTISKNEPMVLLEIMHRLEEDLFQTYIILNDSEKIENMLVDIGKMIRNDNRSYLKKFSKNIKRLK